MRVEFDGERKRAEKSRSGCRAQREIKMGGEERRR